VCVVLAWTWAGSSMAALAPALARRAEQDPDRIVHAWVYFTDRAGQEHDPAAFARARASFTARALERRARRGARPDLVAAHLPFREPYVHARSGGGAALRGTSRWLNAASVEVSARLAREISLLPFVARVEPVPVGLHRLAPEEAVPAPLGG